MGTKEILEENLLWLKSIGYEKNIQEGEMLTKRGVPLDSFYVILDGLFRLNFSASHEESFYTLMKGDIVGEMSFLEGSTPEVNVIALETCRVLAIPYSELQSRCHSDPVFAARLYRTLASILSAKLRKTSNLINIQNQTTLPRTKKSLTKDKFLPQSSLDLIQNKCDQNVQLIEKIMSDLGPIGKSSSHAPRRDKHLPSGPLNYLKNENMLNVGLLKKISSEIEPIEKVIEKFYQMGDFPFKADAFKEREHALGIGTLSAEGVSILLNILHNEGVDRLYEKVVKHTPSININEKTLNLPGIEVQNTLTLKIEDNIGLLTGIGNYKLSQKLMGSIAEELEISENGIRNFSINPKNVSPEVQLNLLRGMVSCFAPPGLWTDISFLGVVHSSEENGDFALSLSPYESLIIPQKLFCKIVESYAKRAFPYIKLIHLYP